MDFEIELAGQENTTQPQEDTSLAVDLTSPQYVNLPKEVVEERAHKANLGLGETSPGVDVLKAAIERGDEQSVRAASAAELTIKERDNRTAMLRELAVSRPPGSPISQDEADLAAGLTTDPVIDPRTVWEKEYATFLTNRLVMNNNDPAGAINGALAEDPMRTYADLDQARDLIVKNERVNARLHEMEAKWKDMGFWESAGTIAETIIPGKSTTNIGGFGYFSKEALTGIPLAGETIKDQVQNLLAIPSPEVFAERLDQMVDRIADTNVMDAIDFLQAVKSYSLSDRFIKNIFGLADTVDITGLTAALAKGTLKAGAAVGRRVLTKRDLEAIKAVDDTLKATTGPQKPADIASRIGMTEEASSLRVVAVRQLEDAIPLPINAEDKLKIVTDQMPTVANPRGIFDDAIHLDSSQAARISDVLGDNWQRFLDVVKDTVTPERLTPEALSRAIRNARIEIKKDFQHINESVLNVRTNEVDPYTKTHSVTIRLGDQEKNTFTSSETAQMFARDMYRLPEGSYSIGQQGTGFTIDVQKPVRETAPNVQEAMITTLNEAPIPNMATAFIQGIRTPSEIFSKMQKANRDTALMGNTTFGAFLTDVAAPIARLSKNERRDLAKIMDRNRDYIDPHTGERGRYYDNVVDLEEAYRKPVREGGLNRFPTEKEVEAYYTAVQINEMDLMLRNFAAYRDLSRQGIEEYTARINYRGEQTGGAPVSVLTPQFKGRQASRLPWEDNDMLPVAVLDESGAGPKMVYRSSPQSDRDYIEKLLKEDGYKIIQVARPQERVLKNAAGIKEPVQWLITKGETKQPLAYQQVGRSPGFHVEYADGWYLKQPRVSVMQGGNRMYEGDATMWSFQSRAQAELFAERVNVLRDAIMRNAPDIQKYITGQLPENEAWWRKAFSDDGFFSAEEPLRVVAKGSTTRDVDPRISKMRDLSDSRYTLTSEVDRRFQGERSQQLLQPVEATEETPMIRLQTAPMIDSLSSTARGIGQAARSRYFGDMKLSVAESWVKQFGDLLEDPADAAKYPLFNLHDPKWRTDANVDPQRLAAAQAMQKTTMEFVGQQTPFGRTFMGIQEKIIDSVYGAMGQGAATKLRTVTDFANSRDPLAFFRAWAFRAKMGFLNPVQVFVQAQGLAHITAIAPQHAAQSMAAGLFTRALIWNQSKEIVEGASRRLESFGWKKGEFAESFELMKRTGWWNVGRESTYIDDMSDPKLYEGQVGKFLDKGAVFFTETERMVRMTGWHAAYREWRAANPTKTVTNRDIGTILSRADTMTVNMTNASKASWERGVLSIPSQFQSYGVRMLEQMWGGQLSWQEKARVLGLNAGLYGVPASAAIATGYPWYEDVKKYAMERGYTVNDTWLEGLVEGIPSAMIGLLGGGDWNIGQRYGPGGLSIFKDMMNDEKSAIDIALGPGGSVWPDIIKGAMSTGKVMVAMALTGERFEPDLQDLIDAARTISSVNSASRVLQAIEIGKYYSRKGTYLNDQTTFNAIVQGVTGLSPLDFTDKMVMNTSIKDLEASQREARQEINRNVGFALREAAAGNDDVAEAYMKKVRAAFIVGQFRPSEQASILQSVMRGMNKSLVDRVRRDWIMKAPAGKQLDRLKQSETAQ
jgi:hypothetical protein